MTRENTHYFRWNCSFVVSC